jgi:uncharacterized membrane protein YfcA
LKSKWKHTLLFYYCCFAGFIDAVVGGGGLIQTPAGLILPPNLPVATVIGTLKNTCFQRNIICSLPVPKVNWRLLY